MVEAARRNGWIIREVEPAPTLRTKCRADRYLYQRDGRALERGALGMAVALPQWPHNLRSHDLRHGIARHLRHAGISLIDLAAFLHHTTRSPTFIDQQQTRLYTHPTDDMLADLLRRFDRHFPRESS